MFNNLLRKDKIRNNIIKQKMNVTRSLLDGIKTKQLQWYGHVQRMEEGRLSKEVMKWRPPGRRKRGRPKLTWTEGIRGLMEEKGLMEEDWNGRGNWFSSVSSSLWGPRIAASILLLNMPRVWSPLRVDKSNFIHSRILEDRVRGPACSILTFSGVLIMLNGPFVTGACSVLVLLT